ncbi:jg791 [Pararge aegeria aegeria]|uniref:Jg791 protein n=1 Tax=Pararge aegeria aegeria TaxID=348720 RepID=A0A8S4QUX6_9NEOP|nr:jg791 [Pararge aegeria aegeria]
MERIVNIGKPRRRASPPLPLPVARFVYFHMFASVSSRFSGCAGVNKAQVASTSRNSNLAAESRELLEL